MVPPMFRSVFSFFFLPWIFAKGSVAQVESGLTAANECRHVSILAREDFKSSYSARCFLRADRKQYPDISLSSTIPDEWKWTISHNGALSGQVLVTGKNSVYMISHKHCIDRGLTVGRQMRRLYNRVGNNAKSVGFVGDFDTLVKNRDAYADCVFNPTQWHKFRVLNIPANRTDPMPPGIAQFVRVHTGGHTGVGDIFVPYNFSYTQADLERTFKELLESAVHGRKDDVSTKKDIRSGEPIVLAKYPFETGLTVLAQSRHMQGAPVQNIFSDVSVLAWNRALESKAALSSRPDPPPSLPEQIRLADLLSIIVLTCLSIVAFQQALNWAVSIRRMNVERWREPVGTWVRISSRSEHIEQTSYFGGGFAEVVSIAIALLGALVAIAASILEFYESNFRYREFVFVNQGGVITYGKTNPDLSVDRGNGWAGTEFSVAHWYVAQVGPVGKKHLFLIVTIIYLSLVLVLLRYVYLFSLKREHKLDSPAIQCAVFPLQWIVHVIQGLLARAIPGSENVRPIKSYETTFHDLCVRLCDRFGKAPLHPIKRSWKEVCDRYTLSHFTPENAIVNSVTAIDISQKGGTGQSEHANLSNATKPSETPVLKEAVQGFSTSNLAALPNINDLLRPDPNPGPSRVTRNEIEKAAEIVAADAFGRLSYVQALTLMSGTSLTKALDLFHSQNALLSEKEVKQLAVIYYITEAIVPKNVGRGIDRDDFVILDMEKTRSEPGPQGPLYASQGATLAPILGLATEAWESRIQKDSKSLNDGILYAIITPK